MIQDIPGKIGAPATISARFEGTAQEFQNSLKSQPILIGVAIIAVYIVLGVLYESFVHPITILSTIPSAGLGALLGLAITGKELSVVAIIGIIMLIGIVKKNAIMMVDFAIEAERDGKKPEDAIFEACMLRFRPIMMTSFAAILGGVPLALSQGYGAELRIPLGVAIVGGLLVSQILTLYTTPVVYLYLDRFQSWAANKSTSANTATPTCSRQSDLHERIKTDQKKSRCVAVLGQRQNQFAGVQRRVAPTAFVFEKDRHGALTHGEIGAG